MKINEAFFCPVLKPVEQFVTCNTFINHNLWTLSIYNFNLEKLIILYSHANLQKKKFLYEEYVRDYIHLFSQPYLSKVYSERFFFCYNIFFTKSKILLILLLILLKTFLLTCCIFT